MILIFFACRMTNDLLAVETTQPITRAWQNSMVNEFNANTLLMKQIIMEGEDAEQLPDFLQRFKEQRSWFDSTLRGTQYVDDSFYQQAVSKQVRLRNVVSAQRRADGLILEVAKKLNLGDYERKKIRVLVLYELNAFSQKNLIKGSVDQEKAAFTDQLIRYLVLKVAQEITGRVKQEYPDFKELGDKAVGQLALGLSPTDQEAEVKKLQSIVDEEKQEKQTIKGQAKRSLEAQGRELSELQLTSKQLERERDRSNKQSANEMRELMKREFGTKLEEKEREGLDLNLQLTRANQKNNVLEKGLRETKDNLDRMTKELLMAKDDVLLARNRVDSLQKELEEQRNLKKRVPSNEKEETLKKAESELKEKELALSAREKEIEGQRKLFDEMRLSMTQDREILSGIRDEAKQAVSKISQLASTQEKDKAAINGSVPVVTESTNKQAVKAEQKEKKQEPKAALLAPIVGEPPQEIADMPQPMGGAEEKE